MQRHVIEAAQAGDHGAFEVLATAAGDRLVAIATLILRDRQRAEDAVQEALVHAWRDLPALRDPDRFDAWLHRLVVHACADVGRSQRRWSTDVRMVGSEPTTEDDASSLADRDQLERGFRRLKPDQRTVVFLHFYIGLPVSEIAETLGIPTGTVKSRLHYATATLRAALEADARGTVAIRDGQHDQRTIGEAGEGLSHHGERPTGLMRPVGGSGLAGPRRIWRQRAIALRDGFRAEAAIAASVASVGSARIASDRRPR